ncbi:MAG: copper chaperone PCu(A)C [Alphaproteobacteria bacterium]
MIYRIGALLVPILVLATAAAVGEMTHVVPGSPGLRVSDAWARPAAAGQTAAVYLRIVNEGNGRDRLLRADTPAAERAEIHTHIMRGDVMSMHRLDSIEIHPGEIVPLQPGGLHIMLFGLKRALALGDSFPLGLVFERAGTLEVQVPVAAGPPQPRTESQPQTEPQPQPQPQPQPMPHKMEMP